MIVQETSTGIDFGVLLGGVFDGMKPFLPILIPFIVLIIILAVPLPGRGPGFQPRDPWRSFKFEARRVVLTLAGSRCEGPLFFAWGRCGKPGRGSRPRVPVVEGRSHDSPQRPSALQEPQPIEIEPHTTVVVRPVPRTPTPEVLPRRRGRPCLCGDVYARQGCARRLDGSQEAR